MTPAEEARFWPKVDKQRSRCWTWLAARNRGGYGTFYATGRTRPAHRVSFEHANGPIPVGLHIDHLCRNRSCVNPSHLEAVTPRINALRGQGPPSRTHCPNGHPYAGENLIVQPHADGRNPERRCRACLREHYRQYNEKRPWTPQIQARCPMCRQKFRIRGDGTLGVHKPYGASGYCAGAGLNPILEEALA